MKLHRMVGNGLTIKMLKKSDEKKHMKLSIKKIEEIFGHRPLGWYTGRCSPNTRESCF